MKTIFFLAFAVLLYVPGFSQNVGISTANPVFKLDVRNGSINTDSVYRIGGFTVIAIPGIGNLLIGKEAGKVNTGVNNTFSGEQAGFTNSSGSFNSFFGRGAGISNTIGSFNSFFGEAAGTSNTSGDYNSFVGQFAGYANTSGAYNSFFANTAGRYNSTGNSNSFFGQDAGYSNSTGSDNSFFGRSAGFNNTGNSNSFFGQSAGYANSSGIDNSFFGRSAGSSNTLGNNNSFFGRSAGFSNTTGGFNSFIGLFSGYQNISGNYNSFLGEAAGRYNISGNYNTANGYFTLSTNTMGTLNTVLGSFADVGTDGLTNATAIGANARVNCNNCLVLGDINGSGVNVGMGTNFPLTRLHVSTGSSGNITPFSPLVVEGSNNTYINLLSPNVNETGVLFGKADMASSGGIVYNNTGNSNGFQFRTNGNLTRMSIDNAGNVGIGPTNPDPAYRLDIAGRMRIRSGGAISTSAGAWLNNIANSTTPAFIGMLNDDYVGMYGAVAGWQFRMHVITGNVAIGNGDPSQKLSVFGNICATGNVLVCSDIRYKTNLAPLSNSLNKVMKLHGLNYFWKRDEFEDKGFSDKRQIGFSAQELETFFPELIQTDSEGYKSVDYSRLTPVLVEAIKDQQTQIDKQQVQINELKKMIEAILKK